MVESLRYNRKDFREFWVNVLKNANEKVNYFNVDMDDMPKKVALKIAKRITKSFPCTVTIWQSENKPKNFHLHAELKEPLTVWQTLLARLLAFDDHKRVRLDLIRCGNNQLDLCDYLGIKKLQLNIETDKLVMVSKYRKIGEFESGK